MLASIFDGAHGLFIWTLDWLNLTADRPALWGSQSDPSSIPVSELEDSRTLPTPKGSFEQVDRAQLIEQATNWAERAPEPPASDEPNAMGSSGEQTNTPTTLLTSLATVTRSPQQDANLQLQIALGDAEGIDPAQAEVLGAALASIPAFSPLIQPAFDITFNEAETGVLLSLTGTANKDFEDVYLPLSLSVTDQQGVSSEVAFVLPIFDTHLI